MDKINYELQFNALFERTPDAVFLIDLDGSYIAVNDRACDMFGYTKDELNHMGYKDLLCEEKDGDDVMEKLLHGFYIPVYRRILKHKSGKKVHVDIDLQLVHSLKGEPLYFQSIVRDVSEQFIHENKINFLANISHEIRTPLNGVIGMLSLIEKTEIDEIQNEYLIKADRFSKSLLATLNDILDFSKIEKRILELDYANIDLHNIIDDVCVIMAPSAFEKSLDFSVTVHKDIPSNIIGDALRLKQILLNLVSNAVKFTHNGHVDIEIKVVKKTLEQIEIAFVISDSGIGINNAQLDLIFEPFFQAEANISRRFGGTGLGLSIVKDLVNLMNGRIVIESEIGSGSRFIVYLTFYNVENKEEHSNESDVVKIDVVREISARRTNMENGNANRVILFDQPESLSIEFMKALSAQKPKKCNELMDTIEHYYLTPETAKEFEFMKRSLKNFNFISAMDSFNRLLADWETLNEKSK